MENRLEVIEKRLLEIEERLGETNRYASSLFERENLQTEKNKLEKERQFILDKRGSWKYKIFWDLLVPIIVSIITTFIAVHFLK